MANRPVIFLSFANDNDEHLAMLKREARMLDRLLYTLHDKQAIEVYSRESADIDDIFFGFNRFKDRVAIFHYAGHASGTHLRLEGAEANASGLAELFSQQEELQLVFLNGCSTKGQVERLIDLGVKAVIATTVPINDSMAMEFARQFYQSLTKNHTIAQSFKSASAFIQTKYGGARPFKVYRGLKWRGQPKRKNELPWGLYVNPEFEDVLEWTLPDYSRIQLPQGFGEFIKERYRANEYILTVLDEMVKYNKAISSQLYDRFGVEKDPRELPGVIIENFPWPIGAQLRILFVKRGEMKRPGALRIRQLIGTYVVCTQFAAYILLSQLWDEVSQQMVDLAEDFSRILPEDKKTYTSFDYVKLIQKLGETMEEENVEFFIEEFTSIFKLLKDEGDIYDAYKFLESVRKQVNENQLGDDKATLRQLCNETEFCLSVWLKRLAFLAKYQLITVKDIAIFRPKMETPQFAHQMGFLNASDSGLLSEIQRKLKIFTDSHSIIIVKSGDMREYLNISPFLVDKNAFRREEDTPPHIYILAYKDDYDYQYLFVDHSIYESLDKPEDQLNTDCEDTPLLNDLLERQFEVFTEDMEY